MRSLVSALLIVLLIAAAPAVAAADHARDLLPTPPALPAPDREGRVEHDGAQIWFATFGERTGEGAPVILLHSGGASSDIWGFQVPALVADHRRVMVIDSRGHGRSALGRSSWDGRLGYERMAADVVAVMDAAGVRRADLAGWSDGAIVALVLAMRHPARVRRIFAFGANTDVVGGLKPLGVFAPASRRAMALLRAEYTRDTGSTSGFGALMRAVMWMELTQPNYLADRLAAISGPAIAVVDGDRDEVIRRRHTEYLARTIPNATLIWLHGAGHFAPLQAPDAFNAAMLGFFDAKGGATGVAADADSADQPPRR